MPRRPVPLGRGRRYRAPLPGHDGAGIVAAALEPFDLVVEGPHHSDAILVLGEALVGLRGGDLGTRHQVQLVGCEEQPLADTFVRNRPPPFDDGQVAYRLGVGVRRQRRGLVELGDAERHDPHRGQLGVAGHDLRTGRRKHLSPVDGGAQHDLSVDLDSGVE